MARSFRFDRCLRLEAQIHAEQEGAPISLAILRIDNFSLMLHPQEPHAAEFANTKVGVGTRGELTARMFSRHYR